MPVTDRSIRSGVSRTYLEAYSGRECESEAYRVQEYSMFSATRPAGYHSTSYIRTSGVSEQISLLRVARYTAEWIASEYAVNQALDPTGALNDAPKHR